MRWCLCLIVGLIPWRVGAADFLYSPASAVAPALLDASGQTHQQSLRYISLYNCPDDRLPAMRAIVSFAVNSLSRRHLLVPAVPVGPRLLRISLDDYGIDPYAFDTLGERGSGQSPFPEPYFHDVRIKHGKPCIEYYPVWLPTSELTQLYQLTQCKFPLMRADWFITNALIEPRYHELLGLGDTIEDVLKAVDARLGDADRQGAQARGAVLFSEVAAHNRILERTPTIVRYGKGYYWQSNDYLSSVGKQDVLTDPLNNTPDAHELIWTLLNGLQGYYLTDGNGKRLDKAATDVASDKRSGFTDPQVYSARNCIICHARGVIPIEDEVRLHARDQVALSIESLRKHGHSRDADRISAKYFEVQINDLVAADQATYETAVKSVTGLAAASVALQVNKIMQSYLDGANTIDDVARDVGYPAATVRAVAERGNGLSHVYIGLAKQQPRKARRDQIEATFAEIASAMAAVPVKVVK